jgi:hypothetical protein
MNADSYFWIGSTHDVCQDYAMAGKWKDGEAYAIVSDGCSSSPRTDWGARLMVDAAEFWLNHYDPMGTSESFAFEVALQARSHAGALRLPTESLDATLLVATSRLVRCFGDGSVAVLYPDGRIDLTTITYPSGAPLYLSYLFERDRYRGYRDAYGTERRIISASISPDGLVHGSSADQDFSEAIVWERTSGGHQLHFVGKGEKAFGVEVCVPNDAVAVAVMTDGVSSFVEEVDSETSRVEQPIQTALVVQKLLAFKGYNGVFAKRRARRFIKDCRDLKWQNVDDVSLGVIKVER